MENSTKRRFIGAFSFLASIAFLALIYACNDDFGIEPINPVNVTPMGTVQGELDIGTAVPQSTGEVRVVLSESFPPTDFTDLQTSINYADSLVKHPDSTSQIISFEMKAPFGTYGGVFVIWGATGMPIQPTDIVGLHGNIEQLQVKSVELTEASPVADSISIPVDFSRVDRNSRIEGKVTFVGDWPPNTSVVALAVYPQPLDLVQGKLPTSLAFVPLGVREYDYSLGITQGTYSLIFVGWIPVGPFDLTKLRGLGFYPDSGNPSQPGTVVIPDSATITGIDIVADFVNVGN